MSTKSGETPTVTFVVPCYKLANLLPECIQSILSQTCSDFEVLIMDDCSPDSTPEVARAFVDPRVKHIRNQTNLGHLQNYNKGIALAAGKYVWLISADDRLRSTDVLQRYVDLLEAHPRVGYVFCNGVFLENGQETRLIRDSWWGERDFVLDGHQFLRRFYRGEANIVCPSVIVRKLCYETISMFPLDMPHAGDRYLWALWALEYDVAYLAEPMVAYRLHDLNIMKSLKQSRRVIADLLAWQNRIRSLVEEKGFGELVSTWFENVANLYVFALLSERFESSSHRLTFEEFEESLVETARSEREKCRLRARVYAGFADGCYQRGSFEETLKWYQRALGENPLMLKIWAKYTFVRTGKIGVFFRRLLASSRDILRRRQSDSSTA